MVEPKTIMKQKPSLHTYNDAMQLLMNYPLRHAMNIASGAAMSFREHAPSLTIEEALILTGAIIESAITPQNPKKLAAHLASAVHVYVGFMGSDWTGQKDASFENWLSKLRPKEAMALYTQACFFGAARALLQKTGGDVAVSPTDFFKIQSELRLLN